MFLYEAGHKGLNKKWFYGRKKMTMRAEELRAAQSFAYERKGNSAVIRRCFSRDTKAVIPEKIEGRTVTEIAAYAFSTHLDEAGLMRDIRLGKVCISNSVLMEELAADEDRPAGNEDLLAVAGRLPVLCGERLEEIELPSSVVRVGRYCFYNCDHLKSLGFSGDLRDWGTGVFTGCHHISEVRVQAAKDGTSMLKDMLDEVNEELCVIYEQYEADEEDRTGGEAGISGKTGAGEGCVRAQLMFPEYYEEGVENTPARILETHVHGAGMRYRNCFQNRRIDFTQYDRLFAHAVAQETQRFAVRLVLGRLWYPCELSASARLQYESYMKLHPQEFAQYLTEQKEMDRIRWICDRLKDEENVLEQFLDAVTEQAGSMQFAEATGFVMEYRHTHMTSRPRKRRRLEL